LAHTDILAWYILLSVCQTDRHMKMLFYFQYQCLNVVKQWHALYVTFLETTQSLMTGISANANGPHDTA